MKQKYNYPNIKIVGLLGAIFIVLLHSKYREGIMEFLPSVELHIEQNPVVKYCVIK
jgi:hypothetical protein